MPKRNFPIISWQMRTKRPDCPKSMPWAFLSHHEEQAQRNHQQSLATLARRGGLSPLEAVSVLADQHSEKWAKTYESWDAAESAAVDELIRLCGGPEEADAQTETQVTAVNAAEGVR